MFNTFDTFICDNQTVVLIFITLYQPFIWNDVFATNEFYL
jgi:hypothetical protein